MTSPATPRRRLHNSDRLYIAAVLAGAMLVPHLVLSIVGDWPTQLFNAHLVVTLLLVGCGWRAELSEQRAAASKTRKGKKKPPAHQGTGEIDSFEAITRRLRDDGTRAEDRDPA